MIAAALGSACVGEIAFDEATLRSTLDDVRSLDLERCVRYAVGAWEKAIIYDRDRRRDLPRGDAPFAKLFALLDRTFDLGRLDSAQIFAASRHAYVRPHRDWAAERPAYTRLHVPLQTNEHCLNSEDDDVFHMGTGEIWLLDASRVHSGGCFSSATRLHLVLDFDAGARVDDLVRGSRPSCSPALRNVVARRPFGEREHAAVLGLAALASRRNFSLIADFLGAVHFDKHVHCGAVYGWLREIAQRTGDEQLIARAAGDERRFLLGPAA